MDAPQERRFALAHALRDGHGLLAGRVRWDVGTGWQLRAEVQSLANTIYDQDVRFLVGLDVFGAAGSSRYGLGTGRSLP